MFVELATFNVYILILQMFINKQKRELDQLVLLLNQTTFYLSQRHTSHFLRLVSITIKINIFSSVWE